MDEETQSLIVKAKLGNKEALNFLFARYQERVLRIVRLRLGHGMREKLKLQSMDIVQEVFIAALKNLEKFEPKSMGAFLHWLSKIVENYIRDRMDYSQSQKRHAVGGEVSIDKQIGGLNGEHKISFQIKSNGPLPSQFAVNKERKEFIDSLLQQLDSDDREIIIQRVLEEMTYKEIAELRQKNESEEAVRKRHARAFKQLIGIVENNPNIYEIFGQI